MRHPKGLRMTVKEDVSKCLFCGRGFLHGNRNAKFCSTTCANLNKEKEFIHGGTQPNVA